MATIKDVARLAGVGVGTASRAISGRGSISQVAAERVQAAVATLNFHPSQIGRALSNRSLGMIGVFVPVISGSFYAPILQLTDNELYAIGRHMVLVTGSGHGDMRTQAKEAIDSLILRGCDGILVLSHSLLDEDLIEIHRKFPKIAILGRHIEQLSDNCFSVDDQQGGRLAAQALLQHGHRRLAVMAGSESAPDSRARVEGFLATLEQAGLARSSIALVYGDFTTDGGWLAAQKLLELKPDVTGLFCANDDMAMGAMCFLQEHGIRIPQDVSVIGHDDIKLAAFTAPRLTSIHFPIETMTLQSLHWLLNRCYGAVHQVQREFPISFTLRASLGPAPGATLD